MSEMSLWLMKGYTYVPDFGTPALIVSLVVCICSLLGSMIGFFTLKTKPRSFYLIFAVILSGILVVCIDIDHLIIVVGCGLPCFLVANLALVMETALRKLDRRAAKVAAGVTLFTVALFFVMTPIGQTVYSMLTTTAGGPASK
jgi:hypothetical protein